MSELSPEQVRAVIECGVQHRAIANPPTDEAAAKKIADEIVGTCLSAYATGQRSDAIMDVLFAISVQPTEANDFADVYLRKGVQPPTPVASAPSPAPTTAQAVPAAFGAAPVAPAPASAPAPAPVPAGFAQPQPISPVPVAVQPAPAPAAPASPPAPAPVAPQGGPAHIDIDSIFPGYDDLKARDIVETIEANVASGNLTPEEWEQIKAYEAANEGRQAITSLAPKFPASAPPALPAPAVSSAPGQPATDVALSAVGQPSQSQQAGGYDLEQAYGSGALGMTRAQQESLPAPPQWQGGEPVLPVDITAASPEDITRLAMQFNSLFARTTWILSQEEGREKACAHLENEYHRAAFARAYERLKSGLEKVTAAALTEIRQHATAEADADETVKKWRDLRVQHGIEARDLKARIVGYEATIDRLSREQSRREKIAGSPMQG